MRKSLNKEILRLAIPSILANMTVPLVGMVDTALAGHLDAHSASYIGAISVGSMFFSLLYWSFAFLRTGTSGLTAQAFGRNDMQDCGLHLYRGLSLSLIIAAVMLLLQTPFLKFAVAITDGSEAVETLAQQYFYIRVWAAPATLSLMAFRGWFIGMQRTTDSMWADLIINITNIIASYLLTFGVGSWDGIGFDGIALGTVIAQYCGLVYCCLCFALRYRKRLSGITIRREQIFSKIGDYFKMNLNLLVRSFFFILIYIGYTMLSAKFGDVMLSCGAIMMQLLMLFSYFTDGFAYAGEALSGRFIGARDKESFRASVRGVFIWSLSITGMFMLFYVLADEPLLRIMTSDVEVLEECSKFLPWLVLMPPLGCIAFTWDGIYLGGTDAKSLRNSMGGATIAFFGIWYLGKWLLHPVGATAIHLLLAAYFAHLIFRSIYLTTKYKSLMAKF